MGRRTSRSQFYTDGKKIFENARKPQLAPLVKKDRLAKAECYFQKYLDSSKTLDKIASSYKQLALLNWWAAKDAAKDIWNSGKAVVDTAESEGKQNEVKERLKKCVEYFLSVEYCLSADDGQLCGNNVEKSVGDIITWSSELLDAHPASFTPVMTVICMALETSKWGAECYLKLAGSIFERGTKCLEIESSSSKVPGQGGYRKCMEAMLKCEEILQLPCFENIDLEGRVSDLKRDVRRYLADSKAILYSIDGEGYLEKDMILEAIDFFKLAVNTGNRPEYRAFAYSRLGTLYCFLRDDSKAHYNHSRSVDIAGQDLSPRVKSAQWYNCSREAVEKHRVEETMEKHRVEETRRKVTAVEKAAKNTKNLMSFINYLFENFPHPNKKPGPVSEKTAWREAVKIYHPDRNTKESKHWQLLCDAIMKELNKKKLM